MTAQLALFDQIACDVDDRRAFRNEPPRPAHGVWPRRRGHGQPTWSWRIGMLLNRRAELLTGAGLMGERERAAIDRRRAELNRYADLVALRAGKGPRTP